MLRIEFEPLSYPLGFPFTPCRHCGIVRALDKDTRAVVSYYGSLNAVERDG